MKRAEVISEFWGGLRPNNKGRAIRKRHPDLFNGSVESQRETLIDPVGRFCHADPVKGGGKMRDILMQGNDALGPARASGMLSRT